MAKDRMDLGAFVSKLLADDDVDVLREGVRVLAQALMDAEVRLLEEASEDILAYMHFPDDHRRRLHSTNPLERLHKEVKRRSHVVGIFPNRASLIRLVGMVLLEQDDEWAVVDRRYFSLESMARIGAEEGGETTRQLVAAIA